MRLLIASTVLLAACGGTHSPASSAPRPEPATNAQPTPDQEPSGAPGPSSYEVHEWGLVDVVGTTFEVGSGPGPRTTNDAPRPVRKPVVYFHLDGSTPIDVRVTAT